MACMFNYLWEDLTVKTYYSNIHVKVTLLDWGSLLGQPMTFRDFIMKFNKPIINGGLWLVNYVKYFTPIVHNPPLLSHIYIFFVKYLLGGGGDLYRS